MKLPGSLRWVLTGVALGLLLGAASLLWSRPGARSDRLPTPSPAPGLARPVPEVLPTEGDPFAVPYLPRLNSPAPDFRLPVLDEETELALSDFAGQPVIVNFWASWCPPCKAEMPRLQAAYQEYQAEGLVVIGVDDLPSDDLEQVRALIAELEITFPIVLDEEGFVMGRAYRVFSLPTTYFVGRDGVIRHIQVGEVTQDVLDDQVEALLQE